MTHSHDYHSCCFQTLALSVRAPNAEPLLLVLLLDSVIVVNKLAILLYFINFFKSLLSHLSVSLKQTSLPHTHRHTHRAVVVCDILQGVKA